MLSDIPAPVISKPLTQETDIDDPKAAKNLCERSTIASQDTELGKQKEFVTDIRAPWAPTTEPEEALNATPQPPDTNEVPSGIDEDKQNSTTTTNNTVGANEQQTNNKQDDEVTIQISKHLQNEQCSDHSNSDSKKGVDTVVECSDNELRSKQMARKKNLIPAVGHGHKFQPGDK